VPAAGRLLYRNVHLKLLTRLRMILNPAGASAGHTRLRMGKKDAAIKARIDNVITFFSNAKRIQVRRPCK